MKKFVFILWCVVTTLIFIYALFIITRHPSAMDLVNKAKVFNININGVIHIGAYDGDERDVYKSLGVNKILWIEADPDTYNKLLQNVKPDGKNIIAANFAASDKNGITKLYRASNEKASSSILEFNTVSKVYPDLKTTDLIEVIMKPLDDYFLESKVDPLNYNALVIDIQGAELLALRGATNTLKNIDCIIAEVNYSELYLGGARIWELDQFLLDNNFVRVDTISARSSWGDALYVKKSLFPN